MRLLMETFHLLCVVALCAWVPSASAESAADPKQLDAIVDKALQAYNANDAKAFFADYAKSVESIATPQTFDSMYRGLYFTQHGKYLSRKMNNSASVLTGDFLVVIYDPVFEKTKKVKLALNFAKEGTSYKIVQMQFDTQP